MDVVVNDEPMTLAAPCRVCELLEHLNLAEAPCAVEVNRVLVPKRDHATHALADGDHIEIVTLVGGG